MARDARINVTLSSMALLIGGLAQGAFAVSYQFGPMRSTQWAGAPAGKSVAPGGSYTVYTGLADDASQLYLTDNDTPLRDDAVTFDGVEEQINDYLNISGLPLSGQRRFVTESTTNNGNGSKTDTFRIRCVNAAGAPADLWPAGLAFGNTPLPHAGIGLGLDMPAVLGGSQPIAMQPGSVITSLTIEVLSDGVLGGQIDLPLSTFIGPDPSHWNGVLGIILFSAANTSAIDSQITLRLTSTNVPEPSTFAALASAALLPLCTRRRARPV